MAEASIRVSKLGSNGRPTADVFIPAKTSLEDVNGLVQKYVTRNSDLLKKVGLKACTGCISGFDIWIRQHYDVQLQVKFGK